MASTTVSTETVTAAAAAASTVITVRASRRKARSVEMALLLSPTSTSFRRRRPPPVHALALFLALVGSSLIGSCRCDRDEDDEDVLSDWWPVYHEVPIFPVEGGEPRSFLEGEM